MRETDVVHFRPADLAEILGREALRRLSLKGEHSVRLQVIIERGEFSEIIVRVAPQIEAGRCALARSTQDEGKSHG